MALVLVCAVSSSLGTPQSKDLSFPLNLLMEHPEQGSGENKDGTYTLYYLQTNQMPLIFKRVGRGGGACFPRDQYTADPQTTRV